MCVRVCKCNDALRPPLPTATTTTTTTRRRRKRVAFLSILARPRLVALQDLVWTLTTRPSTTPSLFQAAPAHLLLSRDDKEKESLTAVE